MLDHRFFTKVVRGLERDQHLSVGEKIRKGVRLVSESTRARVSLRSCNDVGSGARVVGRMRVENRGRIVVGKDFVVHSTFVPTELLSGEQGTIELGDGVWINFGAVIAAKHSVKIGHRVQIGPHCIVSDVEIPESVLEAGDAPAKPVEIGDDAWLAGRVTLRPGVRIGARSVIAAGSIVESDIPPSVLAAGIPARVLRTLDGGPTNGTSATHVLENAHSGSQVAPPVALTPDFFGTLIADFTIDELAEELRSGDPAPALGAVVAPFGQVAQALLQPPSSDGADFAVVWTRPESVIPSFARTLAFDDVPEQILLDEVDAFSRLVESASPHYKQVFVPTWTVAPWVRGLGVIDARPGGVARALLSMNLRLCDNLARKSNVFVLAAERWFEATGRTGPKGWYLGKMAVPRPVLAEAAADIKAAVTGLRGGARKLLVLDLDDTLWGGIVGDVGWEELRLGGHDGVGEALADFQRLVKNVKQRGVVLAIVSKNDEQVALEAIRKHPEMVLREDDFVGWKINWIDKAKNIVDLTQELNLGLQSVVFVDDNPVERARVREALPEVFVPEWPEDKLLYPSAFQKLRCFDTPARTQEDADRTRLYVEERHREQLQKQVGSVAEWLRSLQMKVRVEPLGAGNVVRATQLLNKTNQLNLSTRRLTEAELLEWARGASRSFWTISVADRFGDAGLTGLLSIERDGDEVRIVDYVLSCRVMGRKVEEMMAHVAVTAAAEQAAKRVVARYRPTPKNKPCLSFFLASGFSQHDEHRFMWDASQPYPRPDEVALHWER
jgi:FkbH-like protein